MKESDARELNARRGEQEQREFLVIPLFLLFSDPHRQFAIQTFNPGVQVLLAGNF